MITMEEDRAILLKTYANYINYALDESDEGLKDKLVEICEKSEDERKKMGKKARQFILEKFEITILGCGAALPTPHHFCSSQVVNIREKLFMVDCGEGVQLQLRRCRVRFTKVGHVFISHLHGDHCFG